MDYGCGKGHDVRELEAHGITVSGWDPIFNPEGDLSSADIVNLGFVLNVIEDRAERDETLRRAFEYAQKLIIVSVMIAGETLVQQFRPFKDGVVTSRNTFQKYYSQAELRQYIESVLSEPAIAIGQGMFIVFRDKLEEQLFLFERQHVRRAWKQITQRERATPEPIATKTLIERHQALFDDYWHTTLDLGRAPAANEFEFSDRIRAIAGSYKRAHEAVLTHFGETLYKDAQRKRREDLLVYFSLGLFGHRKPYRHMPDSLQRDCKAFFSSYNEAQGEAKNLLFSVGDPAVIRQACIDGYQQLQCGLLDGEHSYTTHKHYLRDLPATLRVYIGCALQLFGDIDAIHLIKIHMTSGKVTLLRYDDWTKDEPLLVERIKIKMREQDIDFFEYGEQFPPPPLQNKERFAHSD